MKQADQVAILEKSFGTFMEAEERLKAYSQRIGALNREIKALREHRDGLHGERLALIEECKSLAIQMDGVREEIAPLVK
jgi:hypothetical protein